MDRAHHDQAQGRVERLDEELTPVAFDGARPILAQDPRCVVIQNDRLGDFAKPFSFNNNRLIAVFDVCY